MAGAQVVDEHAFLVDVVNDGHVTLGQVDHVDVVTHTSAVGRVVVVAVDLDFLELADRDLGHVRGEVRRNTLRIFAQQAGLVCADRVEVAQQHDGPGRIGHMYVAQNLLLEQLGGAVRVGGAAGRRLLGNRQFLRRAVHGGGGGEDDLLDVVLLHHLEQHKRGVQVVVVVFDRLGHGLAHGLETGEVNDPIDVVFGEDAFHKRLIAHVTVVTLDRLAGDLLDALKRHGRRVAVVIYGNNVVALVEQFDVGVGGDESSTARNQNSSHISSFGRTCLRFSFSIELTSLDLFHLAAKPRLSRNVCVVAFCLKTAVLPRMR